MICASCLPTGAEEVPYRMDASNQAGWWSPLAEQDGNVFVAYNGWGRSTSGESDDTHTVYVARRTAAGTWTRGCLKVAGAAPGAGACVVFDDDIGHNQPSLAIDGDGHIHVWASMHGHPWRYYRSASPGDPTTMVDVSTEMADQDRTFTYPNATRTPNGDVYVIVRDGATGRLHRWDNVAKTWSRAATFAQEPGYVVYPDDLVSDAGGDLHIAWEWAYGGANGLRHLASYVRYDPDSGTFSDAAGVQQEAPLGIDDTTVYQPLMAGEDSTDRGSDANPPGVQSAKLAIDPDTGQPMAAYRVRATAGGNFQVRFARWTGTDWQRETVYAGNYTTFAAIDVTVHAGQPRVYFAKSMVPNGDQAFVSVRSPSGAWVEGPPLLPGIKIERLSVVEAANGAVDHVYLSSPPDKKLYLRRLDLPV
jgi:hypothetical protein